MEKIYVSVGSNIDRHINIYAGLNALKQRYGELQISSVYETEAVGFDGDPFFNLVVTYETDETPQVANQFLKAVETMQGREHQQKKFSPRTLDMDLLLYSDKQFDFPGLKIPRGEIFKYAFVLEPLAELAPDMVCPGQAETFLELWKRFQNEQKTLKSSVIDWKVF